MPDVILTWLCLTGATTWLSEQVRKAQPSPAAQVGLQLQSPGAAPPAVEKLLQRNREKGQEVGWELPLPSFSVI